MLRILLTMAGLLGYLNSFSILVGSSCPWLWQAHPVKSTSVVRTRSTEFERKLCSFLIFASLPYSGNFDARFYFFMASLRFWVQFGVIPRGCTAGSSVLFVCSDCLETLMPRVCASVLSSLLMLWSIRWNLAALGRFMSTTFSLMLESRKLSKEDLEISLLTVCFSSVTLLLAYGFDFCGMRPCRTLIDYMGSSLICLDILAVGAFSRSSENSLTLRRNISCTSIDRI